MIFIFLTLFLLLFVSKAYFEIRLHSRTKSLLRIATQIDEVSRNSELMFSKLKCDVDGQISRLNSISDLHAGSYSTLNVLSEVIVYTKTRVITYYDQSKNMVLSIKSDPEFLAAGIELHHGELEKLLKFKENASLPDISDYLPKTVDETKIIGDINSILSS